MGERVDSSFEHIIAHVCRCHVVAYFGLSWYSEPALRASCSALCAHFCACLSVPCRGALVLAWCRSRVVSSSVCSVLFPIEQEGCVVEGSYPIVEVAGPNLLPRCTERPTLRVA